MNMKKIGMITIGQSPRPDVVPEIKEILGTGIHVLQAGAFAQGVVGQVEDVVGLVEGAMDLQQVQAVIDGLDQAEAARQQVDRAEAAVGEAAAAVGDLVVGGGGGEHRSVGPAEVGRVETAGEAALAAVQLVSYLGVHSKSLAWLGG